MVNQQLIKPASIVVLGASDDIRKPGGKLLKNLIDTHYSGSLMVINPLRKQVQGLPSWPSVEDFPGADLAVLAIPAKACPDAIKILAQQKGVKAFIVISAGFSELDQEGALLEQNMLHYATEAGASLLGPNSIGLITPFHTSVFTSPTPKIDPRGVDFVSSSGATAVFIMESAIPKGVHFHSVYSVGNAVQIGVEEVLAYWDETHDQETSPKVKLLYLENIRNPDKLLYHSVSLIKKGCRIAAIKAGSTEAGSRAASSHTGAMASPDLAVEALFRKAGIVRCFGREELTTVACVFLSRTMKGKNMAIITHAGGPAVMLTDALENGGLSIPAIPDSPAKRRLKEALLHGSSVENPFDMLATGQEPHLEAIIDACEHDFDTIDAMAVIYGSPGLFPVGNVYKLLDKKMKSCKKPIFPILPSVTSVHDDLAYFLSHGNVNFPDEVLLGKALVKVYNTPAPQDEELNFEGVDVPKLRNLLGQAPNGYQTPGRVRSLLETASVKLAREQEAYTKEEAIDAAHNLGFPVVMKVLGPLHKTDVGGVCLNIRSDETIRKEFARMMNIEGAKGVLLAEMLSGTEIFIGAKYEEKFGHIILFGLGGIFVEVLKDISSGLAPLSEAEALSMVRNLRARKIIEGYRGKPAVNEKQLVSLLLRLSTWLRFATEIKEMDINPLLANGEDIIAVDARIRIKHSS